MQDDLNKLIDELLERELRPNTREDLGTFRKELAGGTLANDDARYIRALHARVVGGGMPKAADKPDDSDADADPGEIERLQAELAQSRQREQALAAEVAELRKEIDALKAAKA